MAALAALAPVVFAISAAPAGAAPANAADRYGPAPGGSSFAVVAGRPYVAYVRHGGVRVAKLAGFDGTWRRVGGVVRHARSSRSSTPNLIGGPDGRPWITWIDTPKRRWWDSQVRVATFVRGHWRETGRGSRPINGPVFGSNQPTEHAPYPEPGNPSLAFYGERPVVSFAGFDGIGVFARVAQLSRNGRSWHALPGSGTFFDIARPWIAAAGGRLFEGGTCCFTEENDNLRAQFARLKTSGSGWQGLANVDRNPLPESRHEPRTVVGGVADVNGLFTVLWSRTPNDTNVTTMNVSSLGVGDRWVDVNPPLAQTGPSGTPLALAADHAVAYAAYHDDDPFVRGVQVRRLIRGEWETLRSPTDLGYRGVSAQFAPASGRGMWLLSGERAGGRARYVLDGYSVVAPPQLPR